MHKKPALNGTPSPYDNLDALTAREAFKTAGDHPAMDRFAKNFAEFEKSRTLPMTHDKRMRARRSILALAAEFDALTPTAIKEADKDLLGGSTGHIHALVESLQNLKESSSPHEKERAPAQVEQLVNALATQRHLVQPKRPARNNPTRDNALGGLLPEDYTKFARAFAASAAIDRERPKSDVEVKELAKLKHINQVADEVTAFVAMLDLNNAIEKVVGQCLKSNNPFQHWQQNREMLQGELKEARDDFNVKIQNLHLRVRAGNRGQSTARPYESYMDLEKRLASPSGFRELKEIQESLNHVALEFILGGTATEKDKEPGASHVRRLRESEQPRDEIHHKLLTRIRDAYKKDRKELNTEKSRFTEKHDADRELEPKGISAHNFHLLNRVYEARWAIAAEKLEEAVKAYAETLSKPPGKPQGQGEEQAPASRPDNRSLIAALRANITPSTKRGR